MNTASTHGIAACLAATLGLGIAAAGAQAADWRASQDTYLYDFLGNQGAGDGNSGVLAAWNHESVHGGQALITFDADWVTDAALAGEFTATLWLYQVCPIQEFINACPGFPGAESITTDVVLQENPWSEADPNLSWEVITQNGPSVSFTQTGSSGWLSGDVTSLVELWLAGSADFGFSLSQENRPVTRADNGSVAVAAFCDSESTDGECATGNYAPFLEIAPASVDSDSDGAPDASDNCITIANADQRDSDGDGYGNACDADLNNDCIVNPIDLGLFRLTFFSDDADADFNGDGIVNVIDLGTLRTLFFEPPGPAGQGGLCGS